MKQITNNVHSMPLPIACLYIEKLWRDRQYIFESNSYL